MRMSLESRLREILRERRDQGVQDAQGAQGASSAQIGGASSASRLGQAAEVFDGDILQTASGACVVVDRFYPADHCHGLVRIGDVPGRALATQEELSLIGGEPSGAMACRSRR